MLKNEGEPLYHSICIKNLNVRAQYIKLLEKIMSESLWSWIRQYFLRYDTRAQATKEKIDKLDLIKIKSSCVSKDTIKNVKRQPTEWETVFANHLSGTGLVSSIYKGLLKLSTKKTTQLRNVQKDSYRHFSKEDKQMTNKHVKRCLTSLVTR